MDRNLIQTFPNVWRLVANNPSPMTGLGTNTYLVGKEKAVIIDPGPHEIAHFDNILAALQAMSAEAQAVIVTHPHADHNGCAQLLASELSVPLHSFEKPYRHGAIITLDELTLQVHHTPGHIHAHICLLLVEQALLFAGDLVAGQGTILIIPPDGDMAAYLNSLRAMLSLDVRALLPGHGPVIDRPQQLLQEYIDHRLTREDQVLDLFTRGYTTARDIARQIYADRLEVIGIATMQVEAHLEKLKRERRL